MKLSSPIYTLKRQAKRLSRDNGMPLHQALNRIATQEGYSDWSHLTATYAKATPAQKIIRQMRPGDMMLIAARPGHGKTLLGLELGALAPRINRTGHVFTLDDTETQVHQRLSQLGYDPAAPGQSIVVDTSDSICADHIMNHLTTAPDKALIVVDYLQLLDQRRSTPQLDHQIQALRSFATQHGAIIVAIAQIDRAFERSAQGLPGVADIRLPNPADLSLFDTRCFLHDGVIQLEKAA